MYFNNKFLHVQGLKLEQRVLKNMLKEMVNCITSSLTQLSR